MVQLTGGANTFKDADGFLQIEEKEFEPASNALWGSVSFDTAKDRALEESRRQLLAQIHEANRRTIAAQHAESSGVVVGKEYGFMCTRMIDGNPNMSLNDIKL